MIHRSSAIFRPSFIATAVNDIRFQNPDMYAWDRDSSKQRCTLYESAEHVMHLKHVGQAFLWLSKSHQVGIQLIHTIRCEVYLAKLQEELRKYAYLLYLAEGGRHIQAMQAGME